VDVTGFLILPFSAVVAFITLIGAAGRSTRKAPAHLALRIVRNGVEA
jgi:hypothetical protein